MACKLLVVAVALLSAVAVRVEADSNVADAAEDQLILFDVYSSEDKQCSGEVLYKVYESGASIAVSRGGDGTAASCFLGETGAYESVFCGPDPETGVDTMGGMMFEDAECSNGQTFWSFADGLCYLDDGSGLYLAFRGCAKTAPEGYGPSEGFTALAAARAAAAAVGKDQQVFLFDVFSEDDETCSGKSSGLYYENSASLTLSRGGDATSSPSCFLGNSSKYEAVWCGTDPETGVEYMGGTIFEAESCPGDGDVFWGFMDGQCYKDPETGIYARFTGCADSIPDGYQAGQYAAKLDQGSDGQRSVSLVGFLLVTVMALTVATVL